VFLNFVGVFLHKMEIGSEVKSQLEMTDSPWHRHEIRERLQRLAKENKSLRFLA